MTSDRPTTRTTTKTATTAGSAARRAKKRPTTEHRRIRGRTPAAGPPERDGAALSRVVHRVEIRGIDLIGAHFERTDDGPLATVRTGDIAEPDVALGAEWETSTDHRVLGCVWTFGTAFDGSPPYELVARFRLTYEVADGDPLNADDVSQFIHWNAIYQAWPFWREYMSSTLNRAQLPRFTVPVIRMRID